METLSLDKSDRPREQLVIEIDAELVRRLRHERVDTRKPVNRIVEAILARHYAAIAVAPAPAG